MLMLVFLSNTTFHEHYLCVEALKNLTYNYASCLSYFYKDVFNTSKSDGRGCFEITLTVSAY